MKRTLIATALTVSLVTTFEGSVVKASDVTVADLPEIAEVTDGVVPVSASTMLIGRGRGGGGFRRGGGGMRRGGGMRAGGMRRGGGMRSGGMRSGGMRRGGSNMVHRGSNGARRSSGARSNSARGQSQHASNSRSRGQNGRSKQHNGSNKNSGGNNHSHHGGRDGGWDGNGGWDSGVFPVDVTPVPVPVVVEPRPATVTLLNPANSRASLNYALGSGQYVIDAGQSVDYEGTQVIAFDRGGSFGEARYTLEPGTYQFVSTDHGWDLHTVTNVATNDGNVGALALVGGN